MTMSSANANKTIAILHGDITTIAADAIVNSANETLLPGGGVSGAIHQAAGPTVAKICTDYFHTHGEQTAGTVVPTPAGKLSAQYILHAIGPRWQDGHHNEAERLSSNLPKHHPNSRRTRSAKCIHPGNISRDLCLSTKCGDTNCP